LVGQSIGVPDINRPALWALLIVVLSQLNFHHLAVTRPERMELVA
jgi:hypothetical protein